MKIKALCSLAMPYLLIAVFAPAHADDSLQRGAAGAIPPERPASYQGEAVGERSGEIPHDRNIHYTGRYCSECHENTPRKGGNVFLRYNGDFNRLCSCHGYTPSSYIHPVDIVPSSEKNARIPEEFPLENGKVTCLTCHDIYQQCRYDPAQADQGTKFLRGGPYDKRTDICSKCHDRLRYRLLNPHDQYAENNEIKTEKCLYCHSKKPNEKLDRAENIRLIGDMEMLCTRCHGTIKHPANADHLVVPLPTYFSIMGDAEKQFDIVLPLNKDQKITCATCHNPHEKGVIPVERFGAKGAGTEHRNRLPGKICIICHLK